MRCATLLALSSLLACGPQNRQLDKEPGLFEDAFSSRASGSGDYEAENRKIAADNWEPCKKGDPAACARTGNALIVLERVADGLRLLRFACDHLADGACDDLAKHQLPGDAAATYARECHLIRDWGLCHDKLRELDREGGLKNAEGPAIVWSLGRETCLDGGATSGDHAWVCTLTMAVLVHAGGEPPPAAQLAQAVRFARDVCARLAECDQVAEILMRRRPAEARRLVDLTCTTTGEREACRLAGLADGIMAALVGCQQDDATACGKLSDYFADGSYGWDRAVHDHANRVACAAGSQPACQRRISLP